MNCIFWPGLFLWPVICLRKNIIGTTISTLNPATDEFEATLFKPDMLLVSTDGCNCKVGNWFSLERNLSSLLTTSSFKNLNSPVTPYILLLFNAVTPSHNLVAFHPPCLSFRLCWGYWRTERTEGFSIICYHLFRLHQKNLAFCILKWSPMMREH